MPSGGEADRVTIFGRRTKAASGERLSPTALSWAHLGSNQEQPGYEPGALTD